MESNHVSYILSFNFPSTTYARFGFQYHSLLAGFIFYLIYSRLEIIRKKILKNSFHLKKVHVMANWNLRQKCHSSCEYKAFCRVVLNSVSCCSDWCTYTHCIIIISDNVQMCTYCFCSVSCFNRYFDHS